MIISQLEYVDGEWQDISVKEHSDKAKLVLLFADRYSLEDASGIKELREKYPNTDIVSVSTSGDFLETALTSETSMSASVIEFEKSSYRIRT
ncbi:MAG: FIST N-terminal domain-containing protein, partial [Bacteroidia bacterium]